MVTSTPNSIPFSPACPVARTHFITTTPWTAPCYISPSLQPVATLTRSTTTSVPGANNLIARTLDTPDTVGHWQSFWERPTDEYQRGQLVALLSLRDGLGGHVGTCHGGIVGVVLDECMNYAAAAWLSPGCAAFTVELKTRYSKPISVPGTVRVRTWVEGRSSGRKLWMQGVVEGGMDGEEVLARGEALFLEVPLKKRAEEKAGEGKQGDNVGAPVKL